MSTEYKNLSTKEKIGQLFVIGLPGEDFDDDTKFLIDTIQPGGVCLFARNTKDAVKTRKLLDDVTYALPFQPYFSIDQEGGLVDRLRRIIEPIPSAKEIGQSGNIENAKRLANITAEAIRILGFNLNYAPVIDVTNDDRKGFIMDNQSRTFGRSKEQVVDFTTAYLNEIQNCGVLACLKHFPGIGAVEFDPHEELPTIASNRDELFETDLYPFTEHFKNNNVKTIMTSHTIYPNFDLQETDSNGKLLPSSLSQKIVTNLLRDELNYDGLVFTDDLEMGAIVNNYGIGEAAKMAFIAGSDFVVICNKKEAIIDGFKTMLEAFEKGDITESRIDESLERIFKTRNLLQKPLDFDLNRLDELSLEIKELKDSL